MIQKERERGGLLRDCFVCADMQYKYKYYG